MPVTTSGEDIRALRERFLELVLGDPDLLDLEFAALTEAWDEEPPVGPPPLAAPPTTAGPEQSDRRSHSWLAAGVVSSNTEARLVAARRPLTSAAMKYAR